MDSSSIQLYIKHLKGVFANPPEIETTNRAEGRSELHPYIFSPQKDLVLLHLQKSVVPRNGHPYSAFKK